MYACMRACMYVCMYRQEYVGMYKHMMDVWMYELVDIGMCAKIREP